MKLVNKIAAVVLSQIIISSSYAALQLRIDYITTGEIGFTVEGTLDAPTTGNLHTGMFFISPNEIFLNTEWRQGVFTQVSNTILINGVQSTAGGSNNGSLTGDSIYFFGNSINDVYSAGTTVSGSAVIQIIGDPINTTLVRAEDFGLYLSLDAPQIANSMLLATHNDIITEAPAVPEPSSLLLTTLGGLFLFYRRKS